MAEQYRTPAAGGFDQRGQRTEPRPFARQAAFLHFAEPLARLRIRFDVIVVRDLERAPAAIEWLAHAFED